MQYILILRPFDNVLWGYRGFLQFVKVPKPHNNTISEVKLLLLSVQSGGFWDGGYFWLHKKDHAT